MAAVKGPPVDREGARRVVISGADVAQVRARWSNRTWNRPPTALELRVVLGKHVREEILYHEALAGGLNRQDPAVCLAMVRKLTMLGAAQDDAMWDELREILKTHPARWMVWKREPLPVKSDYFGGRMRRNRMSLNCTSIGGPT